LVCERDDPQLGAFDQVKNVVRKTAKGKTPRYSAPWRPEVWMLAQDFDGALKLGYERKSQLSVRLSGVKDCSIDEF
jgi:hypothetical protein